MLDVLEHDERTVDGRDSAVVDPRLQAAPMSGAEGSCTRTHSYKRQHRTSAHGNAPSHGSRGVELGELLVAHPRVVRLPLAAHDELAPGEGAQGCWRVGSPGDGMTASESGRRTAAGSLSNGRGARRSSGATMGHPWNESAATRSLGLRHVSRAVTWLVLSCDLELVRATTRSSIDTRRATD